MYAWFILHPSVYSSEYQSCVSELRELSTASSPPRWRPTSYGHAFCVHRSSNTVQHIDTFRRYANGHFVCLSPPLAGWPGRRVPFRISLLDEFQTMAFSLDHEECTHDSTEQRRKGEEVVSAKGRCSEKDWCSKGNNVVRKLGLVSGRSSSSVEANQTQG